MKYVVLMAATFSMLGILACEKKEEAHKESAKPAVSNPPPAAKTPASPSQPRNDHAHTPGDKHADDRKEGDGHDHGKSAHGEEKEFGTAEIAGYQVKAVGHGSISAGTQTDIDVFVSGGTGEPSAVRLWIGSPDGKGAMKMKATINKAQAHNHVSVPSPLPADAKLCIEVELSGGEKKVGTLPLAK